MGRVGASDRPLEAFPKLKFLGKPRSSGTIGIARQDKRIVYNSMPDNSGCSKTSAFGTASLDLAEKPDF
jgi:hypothetical protein